MILYLRCKSRRATSASDCARGRRGSRAGAGGGKSRSAGERARACDSTRPHRTGRSIGTRDAARLRRRRVGVSAVSTRSTGRSLNGAKFDAPPCARGMRDDGRVRHAPVRSCLRRVRPRASVSLPALTFAAVSVEARGSCPPFWRHARQRARDDAPDLAFSFFVWRVVC